MALILVFGVDYRFVEAPYIGPSLHLGFVDLPLRMLIPFLVSLLMLAVLQVFLGRTFIGRAILAVSQDAEGAQYMGIPSDRIFSIVMALSAGIAAAAGVLVAPFQTVIPGMGLLPLVKAFAIVIVGGLGSIPGSILGALLLGYSETIVAFNVSIEWAQIVSVAAVLITLIIRPAGFFGKRAAF